MTLGGAHELGSAKTSVTSTVWQESIVLLTTLPMTINSGSDGCAAKAGDRFARMMTRRSALIISYNVWAKGQTQAAHIMRSMRWLGLSSDQRERPWAICYVVSVSSFFLVQKYTNPEISKLTPEYLSHSRQLNDTLSPISSLTVNRVIPSTQIEKAVFAETLDSIGSQPLKTNSPITQYPTINRSLAHDGLLNHSAAPADTATNIPADIANHFWNDVI